ncbi:MAG: hypothetical protein K2W82_13985 [Candidatus Obscuribacterales bacterium]|nr:hypothetical protein [Candidatus Obscuribacterales bacterium]
MLGLSFGFSLLAVLLPVLICCYIHLPCLLEGRVAKEGEDLLSFCLICSLVCGFFAFITSGALPEAEPLYLLLVFCCTMAITGVITSLILLSTGKCLSTLAGMFVVALAARDQERRNSRRRARRRRTNHPVVPPQQ